MTRSASGHGPKSRPRTGQGRPRTGQGRRPASAGGPDETLGKRITPKSEQDKRSGASTRTKAVRIGAVVFLVLMVVAMSVGCARFDGDRAAFCANYVKVPTFMELAAKANDGTPAQAAAAMREGADEFRGLERLAPRTIRDTVARLGDSAERIAEALDDPTGGESMIPVESADGSVTMVPIHDSESQMRLGVFYDEMQQHHGTVSAVYSLMNYARNDCGLSDENLDLGMAGFGPSFDGGGVFGGTDSGFGFGDPGSSPVIAPPATTDSGAGSSTTPTTEPGS